MLESPECTIVVFYYYFFLFFLVHRNCATSVFGPSLAVKLTNIMEICPFEYIQCHITITLPRLPVQNAEKY